MTDREKGDHWGQLASVLGAEIHEESPTDEFPPGTPEVKQVPMESEIPAHEATPTRRGEAERQRRPRTSANWEALASSLGVELPPEQADERAEIVSADRSKEQFAERGKERTGWQPPEPTMSTKQLAETAESLSECVKMSPAGLEHEPMVFIAHETVTVAVDLDEDDEEQVDRSSEDEESARGKSKRRRRRRPRTGEKQSAPDDSGTVPSDATEAGEEDRKGEEGEEGEEDEEDEAASLESEEKRRPKRRRPRRRRQKSDASEPEMEVADDSDGKTDADDDDVDDSRDITEGDAFGDKAGHRSIPIWQEAINVIVEKNLESRAKKPDGGGQQKRGGRRSSRRGRG